MELVAATLAASVLLTVGLTAGYATRAMISRRRCWQIEKAAELWK